MLLEPLQKLIDEIPKLKLNADAREGGTKSVAHPQHPLRNRLWQYDRLLNNLHCFQIFLYSI